MIVVLIVFIFFSFPVLYCLMYLPSFVHSHHTVKLLSNSVHVLQEMQQKSTFAD